MSGWFSEVDGYYGPSSAAVNSRRRQVRLRIARLSGRHTSDEWADMVDLFRCCVRCGTTKHRLVKDHITPLFMGGSDHIDNIQPLCDACNCSKGCEQDDWRFARWLALGRHDADLYPLTWEGP